MRHVLLLAAAVVPLIIATADDASAQRGPGGAWHGGGGWRGGGGWGGSAWRGGGGYWRGAGWRSGAWNGGWGRPGWGYRGYYGGWRGNRWAWGAAGLVAGTAIGAAVASPYYYGDPYYYGRPVYGAPVYAEPVYAEPVYGQIGGYCATEVRTCQLIDPSVIGSGCSCRVSGGRARGTVVGP
ncbi:hypothetical protein [Bosea sp. BH3]|uniref:hypothetical protein n=1 Tax=Bosea sp. BH3 TaxID=2871701 RepID=UPI0021CB2D51|nr:hypothetical protein [Bosea sp. BH3]MCU4181849.1 hypothetical protein [Bosea sp. BH3]